MSKYIPNRARIHQVQHPPRQPCCVLVVLRVDLVSCSPHAGYHPTQSPSTPQPPRTHAHANPTHANAPTRTRPVTQMPQRRHEPRVDKLLPSSRITRQQIEYTRHERGADPRFPVRHARVHEVEDGRVCKYDVLMFSRAVGEIAKKVGGLKVRRGYVSGVWCGRAFGGTYLARHRFIGRVEACRDAGCNEVLPHRVENEDDAVFVLSEVSKKAKCLFLDLGIYIIDESVSKTETSSGDVSMKRYHARSQMTYSVR